MESLANVCGTIQSATKMQDGMFPTVFANLRRSRFRGVSKKQFAESAGRPLLGEIGKERMIEISCDGKNSSSSLSTDSRFSHHVFWKMEKWRDFFPWSFTPSSLPFLSSWRSNDKRKEKGTRETEAFNTNIPCRSCTSSSLL